MGVIVEFGVRGMFSTMAVAHGTLNDSSDSKLDKMPSVI